MQSEWLDVEHPAGRRATAAACACPGARQRRAGAAGRPGDFVLVVEVEPHPFFRREGEDLHCEVPGHDHRGGAGRARRGADARTAPVTIEIPRAPRPASASGCASAGMPRLGEKGRGDLYVEARVWVPARDRRREPRAAARSSRGATPHDPRAERGLRPPPAAKELSDAARAAARRDEPGASAAAPGRGQVLHDQRGGQELRHPPQTLRLYEREGLLKPSRTEGNTRLYSEEDLRQLEVILNLTRDLGREPGGRRDRPEHAPQDGADAGARSTSSCASVQARSCSARSQEGWQERLEQALVRLPPDPHRAGAVRDQAPSADL